MLSTYAPVITLAAITVLFTFGTYPLSKWILADAANRDLGNGEAFDDAEDIKEDNTEQNASLTMPRRVVRSVDFFE